MSERKIARRYADALFTSISDKSKVLSIWEELNGIVSLINVSKEFKNIIKNPTISVKEKAAVFTALHKQNKLSTELYNFIIILVEKQRLAVLPEIGGALHELVLQSEGKVEATVVFAEQAKDSIKQEVIKQLEKVTKKKIILKEEVDPSIIGGVKVRFGSSLYDATIKGQLERLKVSLMQ